MCMSLALHAGAIPVISYYVTDSPEHRGSLFHVMLTEDPWWWSGSR